MGYPLHKLCPRQKCTFYHSVMSAMQGCVGQNKINSKPGSSFNHKSSLKKVKFLVRGDLLQMRIQ